MSHTHISTASPDLPSYWENAIKEWKNELAGNSLIQPYTVLGDWAYAPNSVSCYKKEDKEEVVKVDIRERAVEILDLYKAKQVNKYEKDFCEKLKIIKNDDPIVAKIRKVKNEILKEYKDEINEEYVDTCFISAEDIFTSETDKKIKEMEKELNNKRTNLGALIKEIKTMLYLAADSFEASEILRAYNIIDENGRLAKED